MPSPLAQSRTLFIWLLPLGLALVALTDISCRPPPERIGPTVTSGPQPTSIPGGVYDLKADIRLLHILNRLALTRQQLDRLIPVASRLQELQSRYDQREATVAEQMRPLLSEKRDLLIKGRAAPAQLERDLSDLEAKRAAIGEELVAAQEDHLADIRSILTESQLGVLTGAAEARRQAAELLTWFREMPESEYEDEAEATAEAFAQPELGLDPGAIKTHFNTARYLPAEQYQAVADDLIDQIAPLYGATPEAANRAILGTFADPRMRTILQDKAEAVSQ